MMNRLDNNISCQPFFSGLLKTEVYILAVVDIANRIGDNGQPLYS